MSEAEPPVAEPDEAPQSGIPSQTGQIRLIAGAIQGLVLYLLYLSIDTHSWPSTDPYWLTPLLMIGVFVPLLFVQACGDWQRRTLVLWCVSATAILAALAWHDIWRQWEPGGPMRSGGDTAMTFALVAFTIVGLFIAQSLIAAADHERKWIASYGAYFDAAWKLGVQLALAVAFVAVFWGVLWLGAVLFGLIGLKFLETLIQKAWFAIPATTLAVAVAIHVTDVRARLVAGIRTVALTLLAWLLPLMTLIGAGFTLSLPFTGLAPLWATRSAAGLLLTAAAVLVVLINTAFQDGDPAHNRPRILRIAEGAAAVVLVPLVLIASYALWLRVQQYGWTVERIVTAATILVALLYAFGYAASVALSLMGGAWMALAARVNVVTAFVVLAVLLALFSPLGDPARLSVASQMDRLKSGKVDPVKFDYAYLRFQGGRYGHAALEELQRLMLGRNDDAMHHFAKAALTGTEITPGRLSRLDIVHNVTVYPNTRALPRTFLEQDWLKTGGGPECVSRAGALCDAFFADFDGDGNDEIVLVNGSDTYWYGNILKIGPDNIWRPLATINGSCRGSLDALRRGEAQMAPPSQLRDWVVQGVRIRPERGYIAAPPCPN
jgi:hypothetical protein